MVKYEPLGIICPNRKTMKLVLFALYTPHAERIKENYEKVYMDAVARHQITYIENPKD